jgi:mannan endo-1,4-beta-mannosidase
MGLVLFNGAVLRNQNTINLFWDDAKLETYINKALSPMVEELKDHPALGFWEVSYCFITHFIYLFKRL